MDAIAQAIHAWLQGIFAQLAENHPEHAGLFSAGPYFSEAGIIALILHQQWFGIRWWVQLFRRSRSQAPAAPQPSGFLAQLFAPRPPDSEPPAAAQAPGSEVDPNYHQLPDDTWMHRSKRVGKNGEAETVWETCNAPKWARKHTPPRIEV